MSAHSHHVRFPMREPARPAWLRERPWAGWAAVVSVCFGAFMGQLDASIVTVAYPDMQQTLGAGFGAVEWVSLSYLLALVVLLVPLGRVADSRGRKLLYLYGFAVFTLGSAVCAAAPSLGWLVLARVLQGGGAALLQSNSVALVTTSVARTQVRTALGVQAGAQALGLALGPTIGGLLVAAGGWRWVFWVNVPVGVVALVLGVVLLPRTRERRPPQPADLAGLVLLGTAAAGALLALSTLSGLPLPPALALACLVVAVLAVLGLRTVERRAPAPLLDRAVLGVAAVRRGLLGAVAAYLLLFAPLVLLPPVLEQDGYAVTTTGLLLTALPAGFAVGALGAGLLPPSWGDQERVRRGAGVAGLALLALALLPLTSLLVIVTLAVAGVGLGILAPANNATVMSAAPVRSAALAGGLVNTARALGTSLGVAIPVLGLRAGDPVLVVGIVLVVVAGLAAATTVGAD